MKKSVEWSDLELLTILGEGQAGRVWLARVKREFQGYPLGSYLAVKSYKSWLLEASGQFERIIRELETGRRIQHPNLMRTISIIRDGEGKPALVMEYYRGETLETYLEKTRLQHVPVDLDGAFKIIRGLASAIETLHQAGVIHRDVKPANVMLHNGKAVLMDLGVISSEHFPEQTTSGAFLGTIRYAAPEYLFGEEYDGRVDIYSLGAIAYELIYAEQFLQSDSQWARLILAKESDLTRKFENYSDLKERFGFNIGEFLSFVLKLALSKAKFRTLKLCDLLSWIEKRVWERPFHIESGKLVEGQPKVPPLGDWETVVPLLSLKDADKEFNKRVSIEDADYLRSKLDREYWSSDMSLWESEIQIKRLEKSGAIRLAGADAGERWYKCHESIRALYRYGYF